MVKKRRRHTAAYKFRVALEALEGGKTISQLSSEHEIPSQPDLGLETATVGRRSPCLRQRTASTNSGNRRPRKQSSTNRSGGSRWNLSG